MKPGYKGPLYVEIFPRTFSIVVRKGSRLNQLRFRRGSPTSSAAELRRLHDKVRLVDRKLPRDAFANGGVPLSVDLTNPEGGDLIGYKARPHTGLIDVDKADFYDPSNYWEPLSADGRRAIVVTYGPAYEFTRREGESWAKTFARGGRRLNMPLRSQGESICYGPDGKTLYLTSERLPTPLWQISPK